MRRKRIDAAPPSIFVLLNIIIIVASSKGKKMKWNERKENWSSSIFKCLLSLCEFNLHNHFFIAFSHHRFHSSCDHSWLCCCCCLFFNWSSNSLSLVKQNRTITTHIPSLIKNSWCGKKTGVNEKKLCTNIYLYICVCIFLFLSNPPPLPHQMI